MDAPETCRCATPPFDYRDFEGRALGTDPKHDGNVTIETCRHCGAFWLHYFIEDDGMPRSGRWWRAPLPAGTAHGVRPETALDHIRGADYHFFGGSYFRSTGRRREVPELLGLW